MKMFRLLFPFLLLFAVLFLAVSRAFAFSGHMGLTPQLTPESAADLFLVIVGVIMQLVFLYVPGASDWYQAQPRKGLIMLAMIVVVAGVYFGLACTPLAGMLGIEVSCTVPDALLVAKAIFILAMSQSATYLYTRGSEPKRFASK